MHIFFSFNSCNSLSFASSTGVFYACTTSSAFCTLHLNLHRTLSIVDCSSSTTSSTSRRRWARLALWSFACRTGSFFLESNFPVGTIHWIHELYFQIHEEILSFLNSLSTAAHTSHIEKLWEISENILCGLTMASSKWISTSKGVSTSLWLLITCHSCHIVSFSLVFIFQCVVSAENNQKYLLVTFSMLPQKSQIILEFTSIQSKIHLRINLCQLLFASFLIVRILVWMIFLN